MGNSVVKPRLEGHYRKSTRLTGWRYASYVGSLVALVGATFYTVGLGPMLNPKPYQEIQKVARAGIDQEKIQPGNMKVWTDPFDRPEKNKRGDEKPGRIVGVF